MAGLIARECPSCGLPSVVFKHGAVDRVGDSRIRRNPSGDTTEVVCGCGEATVWSVKTTRPVAATGMMVYTGHN